jgi:hypothetical protein
MKAPNKPHGQWWRMPLLPVRKNSRQAGLKRIMDPADWRERWKGKQYRTPPKLKPILNRLQKDGIDPTYIEWLLRPEYLKASHGHPASRLPQESQQEIIALFYELDALLQRMREIVERGQLPARPVESFRRWLLSFEKDVEPACPQIGGTQRVLRGFKQSFPKLGRPPDERVLNAFLISEELRPVRPRRYWPIVARLMEARFPGEKAWCTGYTLSRDVGRLRGRIGERDAQGTVKAYREWFKQFSRKVASATSEQKTPSA